MKKVVIVDYKMGNLDSVKRAIEECGGMPIVTNSSDVIKTAHYIVLPGVGSFLDGAKNIQKNNLAEVLTEVVVAKEVPCLGICLGMQLFATTGEEGGNTKGLGWIEGTVVRLKSESGTQVRIPHIGWNEVDFLRESTIEHNIASGKNFYFAHSYHFLCENQNHIVAMTPYCGSFASVIQHQNIYGVQFHPEKSQKVGFRLLKNFLSL